MTENPLLSAIGDSVDALTPELVELRRDLHAHPELSREETRTTMVVSQRLAAAGIRVRPLPGTGLIADLGAEQPAYRVALRADLDALPVRERTDLDWASTKYGVCHACGHDVHVAAVLGAGLALREHEDALREQGIARAAVLPAGRGDHPRRRDRRARAGWHGRGRRRLRRALRPEPATSAAWACARARSRLPPTA